MSTSAFEMPIKRLASELVWLKKEFLVAASSGSTRREELTCEMAVVRLHDAWARFCRELIVLSAVGKTVTLAGLPLSPCSPLIKSCSAVLPLLLSTYRRRKIAFEPKWADATECIDAGRRLGIRNLATVSAALGAVNSPADEIRRVRNYYAHRKKGTAEKALRTNIFSHKTRPVTFELASYTSGGNRVIESWVEGLITIGTAAAQ